MSEPTVYCSLPNGRNSALRVTRDTFHGRSTVDIRTWFRPQGEGDLIRSKRGVQFDRKLLPELIEALQAAQASIEEEERGKA